MGRDDDLRPGSVLERIHGAVAARDASRARHRHERHRGQALGRPQQLGRRSGARVARRTRRRRQRARPRASRCPSTPPSWSWHPSSVSRSPRQRGRGQADAFHVDAIEHRFRWRPPLLPVWQLAQSRVSRRLSRVCVSVFRPAGVSTVTATTGQPAACAVLRIVRVASNCGRVEPKPARPAARRGNLRDRKGRLRRNNLAGSARRECSI